MPDQKRTPEQAMRIKILHLFRDVDMSPDNALAVMVSLAGTFAASQGGGRRGFVQMCKRAYDEEKKRQMAFKLEGLKA